MAENASGVSAGFLGTKFTTLFRSMKTRISPSFNAFEEWHVQYHPAIAIKILYTEVNELPQWHRLNVIVLRYCTLHHRSQRNRTVTIRRYLQCFDPPDPFTCRAAILFRNTDTNSQTFREFRLEGFEVVVAIHILWNDIGPFQLLDRILRTVVDHRIRMWQSSDPMPNELTLHLKTAGLISRIPGIHATDVGTGFVTGMPIDLTTVFVTVKDDFRRPSTLRQRINDRFRIRKITVFTLVRFATRLKKLLHIASQKSFRTLAENVDPIYETTIVSSPSESSISKQVPARCATQHTTVRFRPNDAV